MWRADAGAADAGYFAGLIARSLPTATADGSRHIGTLDGDDWTGVLPLGAAAEFYADPRDSRSRSS
jgi:hypothetical protein